MLEAKNNIDAKEGSLSNNENSHSPIKEENNEVNQYPIIQQILQQPQNNIQQNNNNKSAQNTNQQEFDESDDKNQKIEIDDNIIQHPYPSEFIQNNYSVLIENNNNNENKSEFDVGDNETDKPIPFADIKDFDDHSYRNSKIISNNIRSTVSTPNLLHPKTEEHQIENSTSINMAQYSIHQPSFKTQIDDRHDVSEKGLIQDRSEINQIEKQDSQYSSYMNRNIEADLSQKMSQLSNKLNKISTHNPYVMHTKTSSNIREAQGRNNFGLEAQRSSSELGITISTVQTNKYQRDRPTVQDRLSLIEQEVQQKKQEISMQRQKGKFTGVNLEYFKPIKKGEQLENDDDCTKEDNQFNQDNNIDRQYLTNQNTNSVSSKNRKNYNPDYYKLELKSSFLDDTKSLQVTKKSVSETISYKKKGDRTSSKKKSDRRKPIKKKLDLQEVEDEDQFINPNEQSFEELLGQSDYMNKTIQSKLANKNLNQSMYINQHQDNSNSQNNATIISPTNNQYLTMRAQEFEDQMLTFGHEQKLKMESQTEKSISGMNQQNINQIINNIEKNNEFGTFDLSLDLKSQLKHCHTTRKEGQIVLPKGDNKLLDQYGLGSNSNILIHPQDRRRLQMDSQRTTQPSIKSKVQSSTLSKSKNTKTQKNLKSFKHSESQVFQPSGIIRFEKQATSTSKKSKQKTHRNSEKKTKTNSERKHIVKKNIQLYEDPVKMINKNVNVSEFKYHEQMQTLKPPMSKQLPAPTQPAPMKKRWLPKIDDHVEVIENERQEKQSVSSQSEIPQPEELNLMMPQLMEFHPVQNEQSEASVNNSKKNSNSSNCDNISLIDENKQKLSNTSQHSLSVNNLSYSQSPTKTQQIANVQNKDIIEQFQTERVPKPLSREEILQSLLNEEDILFKYAQLSPFDLQSSENENKTKQGFSIATASLKLDEEFVEYESLLSQSNIDKPRFSLFAHQLQISFILTKSLIRVLPPSLIQKFQSQLKVLTSNIHQSFLLIIDLILKEFLKKSSLDKRNDISQSMDYKLLRNITSQRIKSQDNFAKILTAFRQNNEITILNLKKIIKFILESYSSESFAYKKLAIEAQEIIRVNFGNANTGVSYREGPKILKMGVKPIKQLYNKLQKQVEELMMQPAVIISQNRQMMDRKAGRSPIHQQKNESERTEIMNSPQPQTYRHLSPMKKMDNQVNMPNKESDTIKRCKSTSKNMTMNKGFSKNISFINDEDRKNNFRDRNKKSQQLTLSQRKSQVIQHHTYKISNDVSPEPTQQPKMLSTMTTALENQAQYVTQNQNNIRINDLITGSHEGKNMGVLAQRKQVNKNQSPQPILNQMHEMKKQRDMGISQGNRFNDQGQGLNASYSCNVSSVSKREQQYDLYSDNDVPYSLNSPDPTRHHLNTVNSTRSFQLKPESQQRTQSSQITGNASSTTYKSNNVGADYIRKKYDPLAYRKAITTNYGNSAQKRFNDKQQKITSGGQNKQVTKLNTSMSNNEQYDSTVLNQQSPIPFSQKRGSLGASNTNKSQVANTTIGSPSKLNSLMQKYGSTQRLHRDTPTQHTYSSKLQNPTDQSMNQSQINLNQNHQFNSSKKQQPLSNMSVLAQRQRNTVSAIKGNAQNKGQLKMTKQDSQTNIHDKKLPIPNLNLDQTYDQGNSWNFLLPETKDFIMKHSGHTPRNEEDEQYADDDDDKVIIQQKQEEQQVQPYTQITNVNNNINFYGTVVNHVYSPRDMPHAEQANNIYQPNQQEDNQPQHVQQPQQSKYRSRLTTEKKSSKYAQQRLNQTNNPYKMNDFNLNDVDNDTRLNKKGEKTSPGMMSRNYQKSFAELNKHKKTNSSVDNGYNFQMHDQNVNMTYDQIDDQTDFYNYQDQQNLLTQSVIFDSSSKNFISPEKKPQASSRRLVQSNSKITEKSERKSFIQTRVNSFVDKPPKVQNKMQSTATCIGSGIKNLQKQQKKIAPNANDTPLKTESKINNKPLYAPKPNYENEVRKQLMSQRMRKEEKPLQQSIHGSSKNLTTRSQIAEAEQSTNRERDENRNVNETLNTINYNQNLIGQEQESIISSSVQDTEQSQRDTKPAATQLQNDKVQQKQVAEQETKETQQQIEVDEEQALIDSEYDRLRKLVKYPYLPPLSQMELSKLPKKAKCIEDIYTLVLDLDETLIHFEMDDEVDSSQEDPGYYLIRPGAIKFLQELCEHYELVIFTAAMPDYADWILDNVDRHSSISYRLYRQHATPFEDYALKDLANLGRDLSKTIIIDNLAENFNQTTPDNGIWVESWYDDMDDKVLGLLIPFLIDIVQSKIDVRSILTDSIKQDLIYKNLDEGKLIPPIRDILSLD